MYTLGLNGTEQHTLWNPAFFVLFSSISHPFSLKTPDSDRKYEQPVGVMRVESMTIIHGYTIDTGIHGE
jgi:hypothetical protein